MGTDREVNPLERYFQKEIETASRDEIVAMQNTKLVKQVQHVWDNVPYYRKKMEAKGVTPADIRSIEDIRKLPTLSKQDLRDSYPYGLLGMPLKDCVRIHSTSGTTGKRVVAFYTQHDIDLWTDCTARAIVAAGGTNEDVCQIAYGYGLFTGGLGPHFACAKLGATAIPVSGGNTARQITILREWKPEVLMCTPTYALHIADQLEAAGIDKSELNLRCGIFGAEAWTIEMRDQIEEKLGLRAFDIYGLTEICGPGVGCSCDKSDLIHIEADHFIPEIVDPETGEPLPDGQLGELVFSSISKEGVPLLRYNTHDLTRLYHGKCECGRTTPKIEKVTGRADDMMIIRGVNVFPSQIEAVLLAHSEVEPHYMIYLDRAQNLDRMTVKVEMTPSFFSDSIREIEKTERMLEGEIASMTGIHAKIKLCEPRSLPRSEGKMKRVIDERFSK